MKQRIAVTGAAGFIGSNLISMMTNKYPDILFINLDALTYAGNLENLKSVENQLNYKFIKADIRNFQEMQSIFNDEDITDVIHLAAESHVDRSILGPQAFIETNINGTFNLLEVAKQHWEKRGSFSQSRFHHVSTDEVYGSLAETGFFTEETAYQPNSPYSASKAASDFLVRAYHHTYKMNVVTSNCSNNYGPYQFPEKLIPLIFSNALEGKELPVYGKGLNIRDWLYVEDHCSAIDIIFHQGKTGETYNVGGWNEKRNIDIVYLICDYLDKNLPKLNSYREQIRFVEDRKGHDFRYAINASKLFNELGWKPRVNFEEGLEKTLNWYKNNQDWVTDVKTGNYQEYYSKNYGRG